MCLKATRDNYTEVRKLTENYVRDKLSIYISGRYGTNEISKETFEHIINMGISILETKWSQIGMYSGGDFVKAFVNNDLMEVLGRADDTNLKFLHFYGQLVHNFSLNKLDE